MARHLFSSDAEPDRYFAADCLERLRSRVSPSEFRYRVQALAGHVLLGLGHSIVEINQKGYPDLITVKGGQEFRFEVEAEVLARRPRMLTPSDVDGLTGNRVEGYFAVAVSFPQPCWVLVPVQRLASRGSPSVMALLRALSDKTFSSEWTNEYVSLIRRSHRDVLDRSYHQLVQRAMDGRGL